MEPSRNSSSRNSPLVEKRLENPKILITWKVRKRGWEPRPIPRDACNIGGSLPNLQSLPSGLMKRRSLGNDRWSEILRGGENSFEGIGREKLRMENRTSISFFFWNFGKRVRR